MSTVTADHRRVSSPSLGTGAAVFLDKDGTLVEDVPYNVEPTRIRLTPRAGAGLRELHAAGFRLIIVSNQSGVARGYFRVEALDAVRMRIEELMAAVGVPLAGFYFCPHHPDGVVAELARPCACRKPKPGLLLQAAAEHGLDLSQCWMIGDILDDVEAGCRAGCRTLLLDRGHETEWHMTAKRRPHAVALDLTEAADVILHARLHTSGGCHA